MDNFESYRKASDFSLAIVLDTVCVTAVLMITGEPNNPSSLLYVVQVTLSATILIPHLGAKPDS